MFRLARLSLANRAVVALVSIGVVVLGLFATFSMKQELFPSLTLPSLTVTARYPGASPDIVDREVTKKIDSVVSGVDGVESRTATSSSDTSLTQVQFAYGTDMEDAEREVADAVDGIPDLPTDVEPQVITGSVDDIPVVALAASADMSQNELATKLDDVAVPDLEGIDGVRDVQVSGQRTDRVVVTLDRDEMSDRGITADSVTQALKSGGVHIAGGEVTGNGETRTVQVGSSYSSLQELRTLPIPYVSPKSAQGGGGAGGGALPGQQGGMPGQPPTGGGQQGGAPGGAAGGAGGGAAPPQGGSVPDANAPSSSAAPDPTPTASSPGPSSPTPTGSSPTPTSPTPTQTSPTPTPTSPTPTPTSPTPSPTHPTSPTQQPPPTGQLPPGGGLPPGQFPGQVPGQFPGQVSGQFPGQLPGQQASPETKTVALSKIADVDRELEETTSITRTDGARSLGLTVTKKADANTVDVGEAVGGKLSSIEDSIGHGAKLTTVFDQAPFVSESIEDLVTEGSIGLVFAVLVILLFLLSFRSTIVTAFSIPFSLLLAVAGIYFAGYSFHLLTLGALTMAIGRVVDDSIVVLENIKRHLGYGEEKTHAIIQAVREVAGAVTASTLTTVGVFLPITFVGGQVGELFRPFGVTVTIALLASLLVSLTIIPVLAYWFLKGSKNTAEDEQKRQAAIEKERRSLLQRAYVPVIRWVTKHRFVSVAAGLLVLVATASGVPLLKTNFLGSSEQNFYQISQTMPVASSLGKTDQAAKKVEDVLQDLDGVESYQVTIGSAQGGAGFGFGTSGANEATYQVTSRKDIDQEAFKAELVDRLDRLTGAGELETSADATGGGSSAIEVDVSAADEAALRTATKRVEDALQEVDELDQVSSNLSADLPTVQVDVDRTKAAKKGLSEAQIGAVVRQAFQGDQTATVTLGGEEYDVLVKPSSSPGSVKDVRNLELTTPAGKTVDVKDVADVGEVDRPVEISRTDGDRTATVSGTPAGDDTGAATSAVQTRLADVQMPAGAEWKLGGVSAEQAEAFQQLLLALAAAVLIVFIVMVATFRSIVQPLILLVSIPFAATGAIGLLVATDTALGVPALIGLLMLVGIVVTNAIVLIDLMNQYQRQGMSVADAVVEGGRHRLRPILMTAVATIFALLPMALGVTGGGAFISQPLAIVVIGGLFTSTVLTLLLVPTLYTILESRKERRGRRRREQEAAASGGAPAG